MPTFFRLLSLFVALSFARVATAQTNAEFVVHLDRAAYIVGDALLYKVYAPKDAPAEAGQLVYAELRAPDQRVLLTQQLRLVGRSAVGNFQIPIDWQQGVYVLRIYTLWQMTGEPLRPYVFDQPIAIYNDLSAEHSPTAAVTTRPTIRNTQSNGLTITGKTEAKRRETVTLQCQGMASETLSDVSVSVSELFDDSALDAFRPTMYAAQRPTATWSPVRQLYLAATVTDPETGLPVNEKYLSLYRQQEQKFQRVSAVKGVMSAELSDFEGTTTAQLLSLNPNSSRPMRFTVLPLATLPIVAAVAALPQSAAIAAYLQRHLLRRKAANLFPTAPTTLAATTEVKETIYADNRYRVKDFTELESLKEFIREVMLTTNYETTKLIPRSIRLMDKDKGENYPFAPWFVVDGLFTKDEATVLALPFRDLAYMDIYERKASIVQRFDSLMFRYGVFALYSNPQARSAAVTKMTFEQTTLNGLHVPIRRAAAAATNAEMPDWEPLRLWDSQLALDAAGRANITFSTGDAVGDYRVRVIGLSAKGEVLTSEYVISVK